jgi:hypothetical protein
VGLGPALEVGEQLRGPGEVAAHVPADADLDPRRLVPLLAEVREEPGDFLDAVERHAGLAGDRGQLGVRQVAEPVLDLVQPLDDHSGRTPRRKVSIVNRSPAAGRPCVGLWYA